MNFHFEKVVCSVTMKLLVLAGLLVLTHAIPRPKRDVGLAYNYKPPATSYGVPAGSVNYNVASSTSSPLSIDAAPQSLQISNTPQSVQYATSTLSPISISTTPASNFQLPLHDFTSFTGGIQSVANIPLDTSSLTGSLLGNSLLQNGGNINYGTPNINLFSGANGYNVPNFGNLGIDVSTLNLGNIAPASVNVENRINANNVGDDGRDPEIEISKHLYFYSSPEDIQQPQQRINLPSAPIKQNVKILFIKAPAVVTPPPVTIPAPQQNEEKTLVYVLVKRPEEPAPIEINTPPPTPPSKPEVFFIKYKTQKEAEEAVANIQKQHGQENGGNGGNEATLRFSQNAGFQSGGPQQDILASRIGVQNPGVSVINNGIPGPSIQGFTTVSPLNFAVQQQQIPSFAGLSNSVNPGGNIQFGINPSTQNFLSRGSFSNSIPNSGSVINQATSDNSSPGSFSVQTSEPQTDNAKALSESFGGSPNSDSSSGAADSVVISTSKPDAPQFETSSRTIVPQSLYGVPNKRGIKFFRRTLN